MKKIPSPFLRAFVDVAAPILRAEMTPTRCLNATRVLLDVMHVFGVSARPVSVQALASNRTFIAGIAKLGHFPQNEDEKNAIMAAGGYAIGVDTRAEPEDDRRNGWAGHLCAVVQDFLVDAGAIQMHRPQHGIRVPDILVTPLTKRFLKGKGGSIEVDLGEGARLFYWARNDDRSYEGIEGFQPHAHNVDTAARIANKIAEQLGRPPPYERIDPKAIVEDQRAALAARLNADLAEPHRCEDHAHDHTH